MPVPTEGAGGGAPTGSSQGEGAAEAPEARAEAPADPGGKEVVAPRPYYVPCNGYCAGFLGGRCGRPCALQADHERVCKCECHDLALAAKEAGDALSTVGEVAARRERAEFLAVFRKREGYGAYIEVPYQSGRSHDADERERFLHVVSR